MNDHHHGHEDERHRHPAPPPAPTPPAPPTPVPTPAPTPVIPVITRPIIKTQPATASSASDEPLYVAGVSNLIMVGQQSDSHYASPTIAGANDGDFTTKRFIPGSSPMYDGSAVDTTRAFIVTGKGGVGKALRSRYLANPAGQQGNLWSTFVATPGVGIVAGKEIYWRVQVRMTGTFTSTFAVKWCHLITHNTAGGALPQWSTHNVVPFGSDPSGGNNCVWQVYGNGYTDDVHSYPTGHDQGTQPVGPFPADVISNGGWYRFTYGWKSNTSHLAGDGFQRMWINGTKVLDVSTAAVGVTPSGGAKQWTGQDEVDNALFDPIAVDGDYGITFGGTQTAGTDLLDYDTNIGDGDATNLDTFAWWTN